MVLAQPCDHEAHSPLAQTVRRARLVRECDQLLRCRWLLQVRLPLQVGLLAWVATWRACFCTGGHSASSLQRWCSVLLLLRLPMVRSALGSSSWASWGARESTQVMLTGSWPSECMPSAAYGCAAVTVNRVRCMRPYTRVHPPCRNTAHSYSRYRRLQAQLCSDHDSKQEQLIRPNPLQSAIGVVPQLPLVDAFRRRTPTDHPVVLPHLMFAALYRTSPAIFEEHLLPGGVEQVPRFWESMSGHPALAEHPLKTVQNWQRRFILLSLHGDGVPVTGVGKAWGKVVEVSMGEERLPRCPVVSQLSHDHICFV